MPVYSGGLGVLAGDHLKSASDLGLPLMGVSLMYREGYFRQYLNVDGWQQERYPANDFFNLPLIAKTNPDGTPLTISVRLPGRDVFARVWKINVPDPLYLLDCNIRTPRRIAESPPNSTATPTPESSRRSFSASAGSGTPVLIVGFRLPHERGAFRVCALERAHLIRKKG